MKSFMKPRYFDTFQFEAVAKRLAEDLGDIQILAYRAARKNTQLKAQHEYSLEMFNIMVFSAVELKYYVHVKTRGQFLVNNLLELNVLLLLFHTSQGKLDLSVDNYADRIFDFWRSLCCWEEEFQALHRDVVHMKTPPLI
ncbi:hypothetical protein JCM33374_g3798 [Metschnikowia sp. JCM 33374]|nr:hypothetical protein JCM33374_g3798 [Metschnikowia sp. JCM 33374]